MTVDEFERENAPDRLMRPVLLAVFGVLVVGLSLVGITLFHIDQATQTHEQAVVERLIGSGDWPTLDAALTALQEAGYPQAEHYQSGSIEFGHAKIAITDANGLRLGYIDLPLSRPAWAVFSTTAMYKIPVLAFAVFLLVLSIYVLRRKVRQLDARRAQVQHEVETDQLSGLANRRSFHARLSDLFEKSQPGGVAMVLYFIDLDGFKQVNGAYGHQAGDDIIRSASDRLHHFVSADDVVARLSGDEFAIARLSSAPASDDLAFGESLVKLLATPYQAAGHLVRVRASVGVARSDLEDTNSESGLCRAADRALECAKDSGKNQVVAFDPEMLGERRQAELAALDVA